MYDNTNTQTYPIPFTVTPHPSTLIHHFLYTSDPWGHSAFYLLHNRVIRTNGRLFLPFFSHHNTSIIVHKSWITVTNIPLLSCKSRSNNSCPPEPHGILQWQGKQFKFSVESASESVFYILQTIWFYFSSAAFITLYICVNEASQILDDPG